MSEQQSHERTPRRIAFVRARWHSEIVDSAYDAFTDEVSAQRGGTVEVFDVPGALEIPLHVKTLADSGRYDAVVACAFVVDGGIYRHDFVAGTVLDAIMAIQLASDLPVFSLVLTPHAFQETEEHRRFFREHFVAKGREVAAGCLEMLEARARLVSG